MTNNVCWVSLDPVRRKVDFYPKLIAQKIEKSYIERNIYSPTKCVLGSDFFNATIHFHNNSSCYQTTPGMYMGRSAFKEPGYRSVKRFELKNTEDRIIVFSKQVYGEWRITNNEYDAEVRFEELISNDIIIQSDFIENVNTKITYWNNEDLNSENLDMNVVIWQWCRGTTDHHGNLMLLSDEWWVAYLYEQNKTIEENYNNNNFNITINLPFDNSERTIIMEYNSCYGKQKNYSDSLLIGERLIRRKIITLQELKYLLNNINILPNDPTLLTSILDSDAIPNEFYCCISQDIMTDPVKTIDNHTYDRKSIERWFIEHNTSPLTGLYLSSKLLTPNTLLKQQIENFTKEKIDNNNNTNN